MKAESFSAMAFEVLDGGIDGIAQQAEIRRAQSRRWWLDGSGVAVVARHYGITSAGFDCLQHD